MHPKMIGHIVMSTSSANDLLAWNRIADRYIRTAGNAEDKIYRQFAEVLWDSLGDIQGQSVLDVGCGHGWLSHLLLEAGAQVWGVDGSTTLLNYARSSHPSISFLEHDLVHGLPSFGKSFDRIVAHMVLQDLPNIDPLLHDISQRLSSEGRFIFTMPHPCFFNYKSDRDPESGQLAKRITGYLEPANWWVETFGGHNHYHRSLTYYIDRLRSHGLAVTRLF
jgi:2-polyprenyl-3-methyl-5-hydroxy-6-metoxy-1,4-benzoquinol methylase